MEGLGPLEPEDWVEFQLFCPGPPGELEAWADRCRQWVASRFAFLRLSAAYNT